LYLWNPFYGLRDHNRYLLPAKAGKNHRIGSSALVPCDFRSRRDLYDDDDAGISLCMAVRCMKMLPAIFRRLPMDQTITLRNLDKIPEFLKNESNA
jgi:hypothetical protein